MKSNDVYIGLRIPQTKLTVNSEKIRRKKSIYHEFKCDCGNTKIICTMNVIKLRTRSCGCLNKEKEHYNKLRYGSKQHKYYTTYYNIKSRCYNEKDQAYKHYGKKGIKLCEKWLNDICEFLEWADNNELDIEDNSIHRIDPNGDYSEDNCIFISVSENSSLTSATRLFTLWGHTRSIKDWSEEFNIEPKTVYGRLKCGWDIEKALQTPKKQNSNNNSDEQLLRWIYRSMKQRCYNPNNKNYMNYGMKGITVEWESFKVFYHWCISNNWERGMHIDRIDGSKNYSQSNCQIITAKENTRRRKDIQIEHNGNKRCLVEWCEILNLNLKTVKSRLNRGWSITETLSTPTPSPYKVY